MSEAQTIAARVRYLESLMEQVTQQNKATSMLVTTEVDDVRNAMAQQIAEIKQIVMFQERVYQERIRRLECRVEQLSEFALQIARSTAHTSSLDAIPLSIIQASEPIEPAAAEARADEDEVEPGPEAVLKKHAKKIEAIYDFYTATSTQVARSSMTLSHFTRLLKDCHLCGFEQAEPAELLWMAVIRKMHTKRKGRNGGLGVQRQMIVSQHSDRFDGKANFSHERLDEIDRAEFPAALLHLAIEKVGRWQPDATQEATLEAFLLRDVFPHTDRAMLSARTMVPAASDSTATTSIDEYRTDEIKLLVKENIGSLRKSFVDSIHATQGIKQEEFMTIDSFVEMIRRHDLMPCISKTDLRYLFMTVAQAERASRGEAFANAPKEECFTISSLPRVIYHLADRIYGDPLFVAQFPTPKSRVEKLLAKMFLLFEARPWSSK